MTFKTTYLKIKLILLFILIENVFFLYVKEQEFGLKIDFT